MYTLDKKNMGLLLLLCFIIVVSSINVRAESGVTTITIDPPKKIVEAIDKPHLFTIKINNVKNLNSWRMRISWNPQLLEVVQVTEGDFLKPNGQTIFLVSSDEIVGFKEISCTSLFTKESISGNGILANLIMKVKGTAKIEIENSFLYTITDSKGVKGEIEHKFYGAEIRYKKASDQLPMAIIDYDMKPVIVDTPVNFNGQNSVDPSGDKMTNYEWDFGDGSKSDKPEVTHTFVASGKYIIKLTVTDDWGEKSEPSTIVIDVTENATIYPYLIAGIMISAIIVYIFFTRRK